MQGSLVGRCVSGDPDAWRALHRLYTPIAVAFLRKLGVDDGELDDACQEVFVLVFRHLAGFRGEAELKTWLYRLCVTEAGNVRRRARVAKAVEALLRRELAAHPPVSGPVLSAEMARRKVDVALATLKDDERQAFVLHEMKGMSGQRIAKLAGCPVATVWRRLHYARRTFQRALGEGRLQTITSAVEPRVAPRMHPKAEGDPSWKLKRERPPPNNVRRRSSGSSITSPSTSSS